MPQTLATGRLRQWHIGILLGYANTGWDRLGLRKYRLGRVSQKHIILTPQAVPYAFTPVAWAHFLVEQQD